MSDRRRRRFGLAAWAWTICAVVLGIVLLSTIGHVGERLVRRAVHDRNDARILAIAVVGGSALLIGTALVIARRRREAESGNSWVAGAASLTGSLLLLMGVVAAGGRMHRRADEDALNHELHGFRTYFFVALAFTATVAGLAVWVGRARQRTTPSIPTERLHPEP